MDSNDESTAMETERRIQSLTKSTDIREDMAIVMAPHSNWEEYLMPAPISIAIIGKVTFLLKFIFITQFRFLLGKGSKILLMKNC